MKNRRFISFITILLVLLWISQGFPYAKATHRAINEHIAQKTINGFSLDYYLKTNLGFSKGKDEVIDQKEAYIWFGDGGFKEDEPEQIWRLALNMARNNNHFHNPLEPWNIAGLSDYIGPLHYTGQSLVLWAQNPTQDPGGKWSWQDARRYFYIAITGRDFNGSIVASTKAERDRYFADTFRAVGQQMHLVQDVTVASHTRNDIHAFFAYEGWTEALRIDTDPVSGGSIKFSQMLSNPITFDPSILNLLSNSLAPIPVAKIIDTDKYTGTNPDITASTAIGLAEYVNANFLSEDTAFKRFTYPNWNSVEKVPYDITDPRDSTKKVSRQYYKKIKDGETEYRLATVGLLKYYSTKYFPWLDAKLRASEKPALDSEVYMDYAQKLLPRAVGYSAGLLDYFFRGTIGIERDRNAPDELVVMNLSAEQMNGTFGLYYDDASSNRISVKAWGLLNIPPYSPEYVPLSYCTLKDLKPEPKQKGIYLLVFQGTMGNEAGAVAANANIDLLASSCGKALTITGPDTIAQDTSTQLKVSGCTGCEDDVNWEITGEGATIDKDGLLTVNKTACGGTATITAKCPDCKTEISKTITIPDPITISDPGGSNCYTASGGGGSYTWDISKGSIDPNGCVSATTGQCGITTITITDANGCKTTKTVTLPDTLTITGPDAPRDGDCYTATGGTEPYTWDITKGKIDVTKGCVKELTDLCGPATVKAKDVNECAGKKEVNIPAVPLDISGADMIAKNSSETYSANGCSKTVNWNVTGKGATIEPQTNGGGLLKTDETACREITITAKCPDCNTEASKNVRVSDTCGTLTISGSDTTVKNSTTQPYTASGCCENVKWSVTGKGATITPEGILKTDGTACGALTVKATCDVCETNATQEVRVSDAGQWITVTSGICQGKVVSPPCGGAGCVCDEVMIGGCDIAGKIQYNGQYKIYPYALTGECMEACWRANYERSSGCDVIESYGFTAVKGYSKGCCVYMEICDKSSGTAVYGRFVIQQWQCQ